LNIDIDINKKPGIALLGEEVSYSELISQASGGRIDDLLVNILVDQTPLQL